MFWSDIKVFVQQRMSDKQLLDELTEVRDFNLTIDYYLTKDSLKMRYISIGTNNKPVLFFIHGAPSSSHSWLPYLKDKSLLKKFKLIVPDRLGYGYSEFGKSVTSIDSQAKSFKFLIDKYSITSQPIYIIASSFGGPIAIKMCTQFENSINGLLLISASIKSKAEKTYWFSYILKSKILNWLVPRAFKVANDEKLSHPDELKKLSHELSKLKTSTIIMHGQKDKLVYFENMKYFYDNTTSIRSIKRDTIADKGHFLPWNSYQKVINQINNLTK